MDLLPLDDVRTDHRAAEASATDGSAQQRSSATGPATAGLLANPRRVRRD